MSIKSISNISNAGVVNFKGNSTNTGTINKQPENQTDAGKKKLMLTLGGLAVVGIVTAGIIYSNMHKGKSVNPKDVQSAANSVSNVENVVKTAGSKNSSIADAVENAVNTASSKNSSVVDAVEDVVKTISSKNSSTADAVEDVVKTVSSKNSSVADDAGSVVKTRIRKKGNAVAEFEEKMNVTRYENGLGKYTTIEEDGAEKWITHNFIEPNSTDIRSTVAIYENEAERISSVKKFTPEAGLQTISSTEMKKDESGNVIEIINKQYKGSPRNGGKEILTKIQRDEAGNIIGHENAVSEILPISNH